MYGIRNPKEIVADISTIIESLEIPMQTLMWSCQQGTNVTTEEKKQAYEKLCKDFKRLASNFRELEKIL